MLRFFLWIGRQATVAQWIIILGIFFGQRMLTTIARVNPALAPLLLPVIGLILGFVLLTWIASPLFNFLLRFNRFGRLALSDDQRVASSWIGICFILAATCFVAAIFTSGLLALFGAGYFGLLLLPLAVTFNRRRGTQRYMMMAYTACVALLALPFLSLILLGDASPWRNEKLAVELLPYFIFAAGVSTWIPAILRAGAAD
jgi:hypothetical protein